MTEDTNSDIDKAEFDDRVSSIENKSPVPDENVEIITFSELLEVREDISNFEESIEEAAGYWANVALAVEPQVEAAKRQGYTEKADAIEGTIERVKEVVGRVDGGAALDEVRDQVEVPDER